MYRPGERSMDKSDLCFFWWAGTDIAAGDEVCNFYGYKTPDMVGTAGARWLIAGASSAPTSTPASSCQWMEAYCMMRQGAECGLPWQGDWAVAWFQLGISSIHTPI